jgi:hypothetical protein
MNTIYEPYPEYAQYERKPKPQIVPESNVYGLIFASIAVTFVLWRRFKK